MLQQNLAQMIDQLTPRKLFLLDGIGAVITATMLSLLLASFEPVFGMPRQILFVLAGIAGCFACYSLLCAFLLGENWTPYLKGIAIANTSYCVVTLGLVISRFDALTYLGIAYFLGEIILVLGLVWVEWQFSQKGITA